MVRTLGGQDWILGRGGCVTRRGEVLGDRCRDFLTILLNCRINDLVAHRDRCWRSATRICTRYETGGAFLTQTMGGTISEWLSRVREMPEIKTIRVVLIDDHFTIHNIVSTLLKQTPDIALVGQGANGQEALDLCERVQPDIVLMDVVMPVLDGIEATARLSERFPSVKVLVLSSFQDHESVYAMLRNGAVGYLTKDTLSQDLAETIRTTFQGNMVFSKDIVEKLVSPPQPVVDFHLTDRELEVLLILAEGLTNQQSAQRLSISPSTLKFHMSNIYQKLGVQTRSEALVLAAKNNLI
jgi:NarL family two-component system response regulator LiaR